MDNGCMAGRRHGRGRALNKPIQWVSGCRDVPLVAVGRHHGGPAAAASHGLAALVATPLLQTMAALGLGIDQRPVCGGPSQAPKVRASCLRCRSRRRGEAAAQRQLRQASSVGEASKPEHPHDFACLHRDARSSQQRRQPTQVGPRPYLSASWRPKVPARPGGRGQAARRGGRCTLQRGTIYGSWWLQALAISTAPGDLQPSV